MGSHGAVIEAPISPRVECCMCGDFGLVNHLFQCRVCLFRSQHRYCSNLYSKVESILVCDWCLKKDYESTEGKHSPSVSSSSSCDNHTGDEAKETLVKFQRANIHLQVNTPIKKSFKPEAKLIGKLKMNSCDLKNKEKKELCKGKVRKYKFLQDVCRT
ncbi:hypothetical protein ACHQM5_016302 [Ranunculus cassubicifolius]